MLNFDLISLEKNTAHILRITKDKSDGFRAPRLYSRPISFHSMDKDFLKMNPF